MKRMNKLNGMILAACVLTVATKVVVFADEASDAYYNQAVCQVESAKASVTEAENAVLTAQSVLDEALKSGSELDKEKAALNLSNAKNVCQWFTDQLNNASANLNAAIGRQNTDKKNREDVARTEAEMIKDAAEAAKSYGILSEVSPSLSALQKVQSERVINAQAISLTILAMKYEYENPYESYDAFVFSPEHMLGLLDASKLNESDLENLKMWYAAKGGERYSKEEVDNLNVWIHNLEDIYKAWRADVSNGDYYDQICRSVDDSYKRLFANWLAKKSATNYTEKNVYDMMDNIFNARVAAIKKFYSGAELSDVERKMVSVVGRFQDDLENSWHDLSGSPLESFVKYMEDYKVVDKTGLADIYKEGDALPN